MQQHNIHYSVVKSLCLSLSLSHMEEQLETPTTANGGDTTTQSTLDLQNPDNTETTSIFEEPTMYPDEIDSTCSTPFVSAPSSPGRCAAGAGGGGFYYSAPASPMHFILCSSSSQNMSSPATESSMSGSSFEFDFSARLGSTGPATTGSMSSADELFLNGQIRPMKLSSHLQRPQILAPLIDLDETDADPENFADDRFPRGRDVKWRDRSLRRRTRSMSPLRTSSFQWLEEEPKKSEKERENVLDFEALKTEQKEKIKSNETTPSESASSSRSSSVSRSSKKWVFLKDLLYRSKSEGRNNGHKFWTSISFSPVKDKKSSTPAPPSTAETKKMKQGVKAGKVATAPSGGGGKRRALGGRSAHEMHYTANRAQAEEMRKKTFLPYRQGLLGCLGFSSRSYGAMNGAFARALNPVSSR